MEHTPRSHGWQPRKASAAVEAPVSSRWNLHDLSFLLQKLDMILQKK